MEIIDMITKRKLKKMMSVLFISGCFFIGNTKCKGADLEYISQETANYAVQERGYDLPVDEVVKEEAIEDCKNVMNQMKVIYQKADKGTSSNIVVSETVMEEMQEVLKEKNVPVITSAPYSNMANYSKMEEFLFRAEQDLTGDIVLYRINRDGGIERLKFNYDGTDMYLLAVKAVWGMNDNPSIVYVSYTRIEEWKYTEKGWFGYTLCVPKYPEVSEAVELLLSGENLTVAEVAYKVGISDPFYFSKCFKTQFGVAPSVYQRGEMKEQGENETAEA